MRRFIVAILLTGCGDNVSLPDAALRDGPVDTMADATADSAPDAQECWMYKHVQCGDEIISVCVPLNGCSDVFVCNGQAYSYCGPGGLP